MKAKFKVLSGIIEQSEEIRLVAEDEFNKPDFLFADCFSPEATDIKLIGTVEIAGDDEPVIALLAGTMVSE